MSASVWMAAACMAAGAGGACAFLARCAWRERVRRRKAAFGGAPREGDADGASSAAGALARWMCLQEARLPTAPSGLDAGAGLRGRSLRDAAAEGKATRAELRLAVRAQRAGVADRLTAGGFRAACLRLAAFGAAGGAVLGSVFSGELAILAGAGGALGGFCAPAWALRRLERDRLLELERHLPEMLETVALGLRSGLSFERSFQLYGSHFSSALAHSCVSAQRQWSLGLRSREQALRDLAASYGSASLDRVIEAVVRSLRFGSSLAADLDEAAAQARAEHRAAVEERVAKAPVKMMLPTGALILPAMLLLVLGPVLLELMEGF